ncbi:hypothetical protein VO63_10600 [Streptomyces showdoensis]|uniref:Uncharacterized protein n=1 Tax=Streptomyces showdoensis TaxID=68268 RepID=A0A2P2GQM1_STREW|nr:hypothetical protein VO63_10600 [Streptomyces showdoensis]
MAGPEVEHRLVDGRVRGVRRRHRVRHGHGRGRRCRSRVWNRVRNRVLNRFFKVRLGLAVPAVSAGCRIQRGHAGTNAPAVPAVTAGSWRAGVRKVPGRLGGARLWSPARFLTYRQFPLAAQEVTRVRRPARRARRVPRAPGAALHEAPRQR